MLEVLPGDEPAGIRKNVPNQPGRIPGFQSVSSLGRRAIRHRD